MFEKQFISSSLRSSLLFMEFSFKEFDEYSFDCLSLKQINLRFKNDNLKTLCYLLVGLFANNV